MKIKTTKPSLIPYDWYDQVIGVDIETEDLRIDSDICLISLYNPKEDVSLVIPIKALHKGQIKHILPEELLILCKFLKTIKAVGHNLQFDLAHIRYHWGIDVAVHFDTFLLARMLQLEEQALKKIILRIRPGWSNMILSFKDLQEEKPPFVYDISDSKVIWYSGFDAMFPFIIIEHYFAHIEKHKKVLKLETDFLYSSIKIRSNGLRIDESVYGDVNEGFRE